MSVIPTYYVLANDKIQPLIATECSTAKIEAVRWFGHDYFKMYNGWGHLVLDWNCPPVFLVMGKDPRGMPIIVSVLKSEEQAHQIIWELNMARRVYGGDYHLTVGGRRWAKDDLWLQPVGRNVLTVR